MKRTALLLGGLVGVVMFVAGAAGLSGAQAASPGRRTVVVATPAPAKVAVAVLRFRVRRGARPPRLRLVGRYAGSGTTAAVGGVARLPGPGAVYVGLVAIVNFRGAAIVAQSSSAALLRASAPRPFTVDFRGDAESYRGRLSRSLRALGGRAWRPSIVLRSLGVDARYRDARTLLAQVTRILAGRPDPAFLAALRGSDSPPPPPPVVPPVTPPPPPPPLPPAPPPLIPLSSDPFTNPSSQHRSQVEPDSFAFGSTLVAAFQSGRFVDGGSSGIGFATSTDSGATWIHGFLPTLTVHTNDGGTYERATDPSVAYDAKHGVWLIESLGLDATPTGLAVVVSRSTDGGRSWSAPVTVASHGDLDKNWIVCDNHPTSPYYGNCYTEWDDFGDGDLIELATSSDGGVTWRAPANTADDATGLGGQPVVQADGTVIVPIGSADLSQILSFSSSDGGATWSATTVIDAVYANEVAGDLRAESLPSAEIDADGRVYVVWADCGFRPFCGSGAGAGNDLVMSTSTDGQTWSTATRIPLAGQAGDYFIPGLAVDPSTAGATARLALAYYYYPDADCAVETCELDVGFVSSSNGGATWSASARIAGPMSLAWLPETDAGVMVGDYISTSFANGVAHPFFALAQAPTNGQLDQAIYTTR